MVRRRANAGSLRVEGGDNKTKECADLLLGCPSLFLFFFDVLLDDCRPSLPFFFFFSFLMCFAFYLFSIIIIVFFKSNVFS